MPRASKPYRKIPGRGSLGFTRLWLGADHLLTSFSIGGIETYQRFYFNEIEAFIIRRTARRLVWNAIFGGILGLTGAAAIVLWSLSRLNSGNRQESVFAFILGGIAMVSLLLVLFNTFRGPTCAVFVQSASGLKSMGAPGRYRKALLMVKEVAPRIEQAQALPDGREDPLEQKIAEIPA